MKKVIFVCATLSLLLLGCPKNNVQITSNQTPIRAVKNCDYESYQGKEFVFREQTTSLQQYGYQRWQKSTDLISNKLNYADYVNKHGKVSGRILRNKSYRNYYEGITENCESIYSMVSPSDEGIDRLEKFTGIYFIDTLNRAKGLVGHDIWVSVPYGVKKAQVILTPDPEVNYPKNNLEKLHVIGVDTKAYGHAYYGASPFFLVVTTESGKEGLIPYSSRDFHETNPINPEWDDSTVERIKAGKVAIGMSREQVLLSWGPPQKNNKSVGSYGTHEQWVYGNGQYLYFENGTLKSYQTSQ